jgi:hypothetical protein
VNADQPDALDPITRAFASLQEEAARLASLRDLAEAGAGPLAERALAACEAFAPLQDDVLGLAGVYVALVRLLQGGGREAVLLGLQDVLINIVGSEEWVIYERREGRLLHVHGYGLEGPYLDPVPFGAGPIGEGVASARTWIREPFATQADPEGTLSAVVPLLAEGEVVGGIALYRLLPHKSALLPRDRAALELARTHGGAALRLATLRDGAAEGC